MSNIFGSFVSFIIMHAKAYVISRMLISKITLTKCAWNNSLFEIPGRCWEGCTRCHEESTFCRTLYAQRMIRSVWIQSWIFRAAAAAECYNGEVECEVARSAAHAAAWSALEPSHPSSCVWRRSERNTCYQDHQQHLLARYRKKT